MLRLNRNRKFRSVFPRFSFERNKTMAKKLFLLIILLVFAVGVAAPTGPAAADGSRHVFFTATSANLCPGDPLCNPGEVIPLPNGTFMVKNFVTVIQYTATDPRWTVKCVCTSDQFPPNAGNVFPALGRFVCTPTDPAYAGGWWEGRTTNIFHPDKWIGEWSAQGYGTLDGLLAIERNSLNNPGEIEIIELPGYEP
jgi:hypothetical protein